MVFFRNIVVVASAVSLFACDAMELPDTPSRTQNERGARTGCLQECISLIEAALTGKLVIKEDTLIVSYPDIDVKDYLYTMPFSTAFLMLSWARKTVSQHAIDKAVANVARSTSEFRKSQSGSAIVKTALRYDEALWRIQRSRWKSFLQGKDIPSASLALEAKVELYAKRATLHHCIKHDGWAADIKKALQQAQPAHMPSLDDQVQALLKNRQALQALEEQKKLQ